MTEQDAPTAVFDCSFEVFRALDLGKMQCDECCGPWLWLPYEDRARVYHYCDALGPIPVDAA